MASRFATVSKDEILAVNEASAPANTKKETQIWHVGVYCSVEKNCLLNLQKNHKNDHRNTVNC